MPAVRGYRCRTPHFPDSPREAQRAVPRISARVHLLVRRLRRCSTLHPRGRGARGVFEAQGVVLVLTSRPRPPGAKVRRIKSGRWPDAGGGPLPDFCACVYSALAGVKPERRTPGKRTCPRCAPYNCDAVAVRHPVNMPRVMRDRLRKSPYFIAGKRMRSLAKRVARDADIAYLKSVWAKEEAGEKLVYERRIEE